MKNFILLGILGLAVSCSNVQHPDFAANVETTKHYVLTWNLASRLVQMSQNFDLLTEITSTDVNATSPIYGQGQVGYDGYMEIGKFYTGNFSDVEFSDPVFLTRCR